MKKIPWFFIYSEKYAIFADIITSCISDTYFDIYPIEKPQELFDKSMYKENNHFLNGMYIKNYEVYNLLNSLPENEYFIFSDADIIGFENELSQYLEECIKTNSDIYFLKERDNHVNIGFMLIKNTSKVKELFKKVIDDHKVNTNELDQDVVNKYLLVWDGKYEMFSTEYVTTNMHFNTLNKDKLCIFQPLCSAKNNYRENIIEKLLMYQFYFNLSLTDDIIKLIEEINDDNIKENLYKMFGFYQYVSNSQKC
jgi:hypothetical protein